MKKKTQIHRVMKSNNILPLGHFNFIIILSYGILSLKCIREKWSTKYSYRYCFSYASVKFEQHWKQHYASFNKQSWQWQKERTRVDKKKSPIHRKTYLLSLENCFSISNTIIQLRKINTLSVSQRISF